MPRKVNGRIWGTIECWQCGVGFCSHVSTRFCAKPCRLSYQKIHGKLPNREKPETKLIRRNKYRKDNLAKGLCKHCKEPIFRGTRCKHHFQREQALDRIRKAKLNYGPLWEKQVELLTIKDQIKEIENVAIKLIGQESERHSLGDSGSIKIWNDTRE